MTTNKEEDSPQTIEELESEVMAKLAEADEHEQDIADKEDSSCSLTMDQPRTTDSIH